MGAHHGLLVALVLLTVVVEAVSEVSASKASQLIKKYRNLGKINQSGCWSLTFRRLLQILRARRKSLRGHLLPSYVEPSRMGYSTELGLTLFFNQSVALSMYYYYKRTQIKL